MSRQRTNEKTERRIKFSNCLNPGPSVFCTWLSALIILTLTLSSSVCSAATRNHYDYVMQVVKFISDSPNVRLLPFGTSSNGRSVPAFVLSDFSIKPENKTRIMICAGQHGDEFAAVKSVLLWSRKLAFGEEAALLKKCAIIVVPMANPNGVSDDKRLNGSVDLNRNWVRLSTPETRYIDGLIKDWRPSLLIDAHEWTEPQPLFGNSLEVPRCLLPKQEKAIRDLAEQVKSKTGLAITYSGPYSDPSLFHRRYANLGYGAYLLETAYGESFENKNRIYTSTLSVLSKSVANASNLEVLSPSSRTFDLAAVSTYLMPVEKTQPNTATVYMMGAFFAGCALCLLVLKPIAGSKQEKWSRRFLKCEVEDSIELVPLLHRQLLTPITARSWTHKRLRARYVPKRDKTEDPKDSLQQAQEQLKSALEAITRLEAEAIETRARLRNSTPSPTFQRTTPSVDSSKPGKVTTHAG